MTEIAPIVIINYCKNLTEKERVEFREKVMELTGMAYASFYNKTSGRSEFTKAERMIISQLIPQEYVEENRIL